MLNSNIKSRQLVVRHRDHELIFEIPVFQKKFKRYWSNTDLELKVFQQITETSYLTPYYHLPNNYLSTKLDGVDCKIYRPNHDATHAARQVFYHEKVLYTIEGIGALRWQQTVQALNTEEKGILRLSTFCLRIGRVDEKSIHEGSSHQQDSALLFSHIAKPLGFSGDLIQNVHDAMTLGKPHYEDNSRYHGFSGADNEEKLNKAKLFRILYKVVHHMDLVRCWDKRADKFTAIQTPLKKHLNYFLENEALAQEKSLKCMTLAAEACIQTGNKVHLFNEPLGFNYDQDYHKKRKARCGQDIKHCFNRLKR